MKSFPKSLTNNQRRMLRLAAESNNGIVGELFGTEFATRYSLERRGFLRDGVTLPYGGFTFVLTDAGRAALQRSSYG